MKRRKKVANKYKAKSKNQKSNNSIISKETLYHYTEALEKKDFESACYMIDSSKVDVNQPVGLVGENALTLAAAANHTTFIDLLIKRGANVNLSNINGRTALMRAASKPECSDALEVLLMAKPDLLATDAKGKNALDWARMTNNSLAVELLEKSVQNYIVATRRKQAFAQNRELVQNLINQNAELTLAIDEILSRPSSVDHRIVFSDLLSLITDSNDSSVITYSEYDHATKNMQDIPTYFLNHETTSGWTALTKAASYAEIDTILAIVEKGADMNYETKLRHTALTWSSFCGHSKICQALVQHGSDVQFVTSEGKTALHHAAANGQVTVVSGLLQKYEAFSQTSKATLSSNSTSRWYHIFLELVTLKDCAGRTPLDYAIEKSHSETILLLNQVLDRVNERRIAGEGHDRTEVLVTCNLGCGVEVKQMFLEHHHEHICPLRETPCPACKELVVAQDMERHAERDCVKRIVPCANVHHGCLVTLATDEMKLHVANLCPKRMVSCRIEGCERRMRWENRTTHETKECLERNVLCVDCGTAMRGDQYNRHRTLFCENRKTKCTYHGGCGMVYKFHDKAYHEEMMCAHRKMPCKWLHYGCKESIGPAETRIMHEVHTCPFTLIDCPLHCGATGIARKEMDTHLTRFCTKTMEKCEECGEEMERRFMAGHAKYEWSGCPKRFVRCNLDYVGKQLLVFEYDKKTVLISSEPRDASTNEITLSEIRKRVSQYQGYLEEIKANETLAEELRQYDERWVKKEIKRLERYVSENTPTDFDTVTVLKYDEKSGKHFLDIDGKLGGNRRREWYTLSTLRFAECSSTISTGNNNSIQYHDIEWACDKIQACNRKEHEENKCPFRLQDCKLGCGHRIEAQQMASHIEKRCNLRKVSCSLKCGFASSQQELMHHEAHECELRQVECQYCFAKMIERDLADHQKRFCQLKPRLCRRGCGKLLPFTQVELHEKNDCSKRLVTCGACNEKVWFCEIQDHKLYECIFREHGPCDANCGTTLKVNEIANHLANDCPKRSVTCAACSQVVIFSELQQHNQIYCPMRKLRCSRGCGAVLLESERDAHEASECSKRLMRCTNGCGAEFAIADRGNHEQLVCPRRAISCPNHCEDVIRACELSDHMHLCERRIVPCGIGGSHCARPLRVWLLGDVYHGKATVAKCKLHSETGFLYAVRTGDVRLARSFMDKISLDALNHEGSSGHTGLTMACSKSDEAMVKTMLSYGADINFETSRGRVPLGEAIKVQAEEIIRYLLQCRAPLSYKNRHGVATVSYVEEFISDESLKKFLIDYQKREETLGLLFRAIACGDFEAVDTFTIGGDLAYRDNHLNVLIREKQKIESDLQVIGHELMESMEILNASLALREEMQCKVVGLIDAVENVKGQLVQLELEQKELEYEREASEKYIMEVVGEITARDISKILNIAEPPKPKMLLFKAVCLLNGISPKNAASSKLAGVDNFTDREWWKAAQALLMDRSFLRKLREYRRLSLEGHVLRRVKRECLKHPEFPPVPKGYLRKYKNRLHHEEDHSSSSTNDNSEIAAALQRLGNATSITSTHVSRKNDQVAEIIRMWIHGVFTEAEHKRVNSTLSSKVAALTATLEKLSADLEVATFDMKTQSRSIPSHQKEVDLLSIKERRTINFGTIAARRIEVCNLLSGISSSGHSTLSFAAACGDPDIVSLLLNRGANPGQSDDEREIAARILQYVIRNYLWRITREPWSALVADEYRVREITYILCLKPKLQALSKYRLTRRIPLLEAVFNGHAEVARKLVDSGALTWQKTYVYPAASCPRRPVPPLVPDPSMSAWKVSALSSPMSLMEVYEAGKSSFECDAFRVPGGWDRHSKSWYGDVRLTLDWVTHVHSRTAEGKREEILKRKRLLRRHKAQASLSKSMEASVVLNDFKAVAKWLDAGAYPDYENADGLTPLIAASVREFWVENDEGQKVLAIQLLLGREKGRPAVNYESVTGGHTALICAINNGSLRCAQALVSYKADVNYQTKKHGRTALMVAVTTGKPDVVTFLVRNGAEVTHKDHHGKTAFTYAEENNAPEMLSILSQYRFGNFGKAAATFGLAEERLFCRFGCGFHAPAKSVTVHKETNEEFVTNPLLHHEKNLCGKRFVPCPNGCDKLDLWAEEVKDHDANECPLRKVPCEIEPCKELVAISKLHYHMTSECPHRTVSCDFNCGMTMLALKLKDHMSKSCRKRPVECPLLCHTYVPYLDLSSHLKLKCIHRKVRCPNECGAQIAHSKLQSHVKSHCPSRIVECKYKCKAGTKQFEKALHESEHCSERMMECTEPGCDAQMAFSAMKLHQETECLSRFTNCTNVGCSLKIRIRLLPNHLENECPRRIINCPDCNKELVHEALAVHQARECVERVVSCAWCGEDVLYKTKAEHRKTECPNRNVECRFGCLTRGILAHQKERHESFECRLRPVYCPQGCDTPGLIFKNLATHEKKSCPMRFVKCSLGCGEELREKDRDIHEREYCTHRI